MAGSRVCPSCQGLNGADETRCFRCGRRLPGPWLGAAASAYRDVFGQDFPLTKLFWGISILVFAACLAVDGRLPLGFNEGFRDSTLFRFGMLTGGLVPYEPWRLLSAVFVHFNIWHILFNSSALIDLGRRVEAELGSARFVFVFVASGIFGFVVSSWIQGRSFTGGASGAIFGLMGVELGEHLAKRRPDFRGTLIRTLAYAVLLSLVFRANLAAHLGGLLAGAVLGFLFQKERRTEWLDRVFAGAAVLGVVASLGSLALAARSEVWKAFRYEELRIEEFGGR